ncbi:MAG: alpha/beta hydrolase [Eubacteriales bacterium]|nr:alpha/beta hydrolase [Eubacteriales bacterium]
MPESTMLPHGRLTRFAAPRAADKPALILCPGGGYAFCSIREGAPVARAFAREGIETFVLEYDCAPAPLGRMPLHALSAAVAWVRCNAARFGVDENRIAVGGFSAGAHLAGTLGAVWNRADWFAPDADLRAHRPNALVLCYPVVTAGEYAHRDSFERLAGADRQAQRAFSLEALVDGDTPPAFLWHTMDDGTVPVENTLLLEAALRRAGVPHETHLFPHGVHGLALADFETYDPGQGRLPDRHVARWQGLCAEWLKEL